MAEKFDEYERLLKQRQKPDKIKKERIKTIVISKPGSEISISGSSKITGGEYRRIRVSGSLLIDGSVKTEELKTSGSISIKGSAEANIVKVSGSMSVDGDLRASLISTSGSIKVCEDTYSDTLKVSGSISSDEIISNVIKCSGLISSKNIEADDIMISGAIKVENDVTANNFHLKLKGRSRIGGTLKAKKIIVEKLEKWLSFIQLKIDFLEVDRIIGEEVRIEYTVCREIRGEIIRIGRECRVTGNIYYVDEVTVHPKSKVDGKLVKVQRDEIYE